MYSVRPGGYEKEGGYCQKKGSGVGNRALATECWSAVLEALN